MGQLLQFRWIDLDMFDGLSSPGVDHMNCTFIILDHRRVRIFALIPFQCEYWFPIFSITGDCNIKHIAISRKRSPSSGVVVNKDLSTILKGRGVRSSIWIWQRGCLWLRPGFSSVARPALYKNALLSSTKNLHRAIFIPQDTWLDSIIFFSVMNRPNDFPCLTTIT